MSVFDLSYKRTVVNLAANFLSFVIDVLRMIRRCIFCEILCEVLCEVLCAFDRVELENETKNTSCHVLLLYNEGGRQYDQSYCQKIFSSILERCLGLIIPMGQRDIRTA